MTKKTDPTTLELLEKSAVEMAADIASGKISSAELTERHIEFMQTVNPQLNAVVKDRFDEARSEAARADELQKSSKKKLPPFHGVPCTVKEAFALTGMPSTAGMVSRINNIAEKDATVVERLRTAGAIPLGITNVSELCMWMESSNRVYGRSNNPYDLRCIVGGSSGGEGAIIGSGASAFGIGSDIGGSIRMPAFFNGVFGHKPTGGRVPATGQYPIAEGDALRYLTTGILSRKAEDLYPLMKLISGPDGHDEACVEMPFEDPATVSFEGRKVYSIQSNGAVKVHADLRRAQEKCETWFKSEGAVVEVIKIDRLKHSFDIWSAMLARAGGKTFAELMGNGSPFNAALELGRWTAGLSAHTLPAILLALLEGLAHLAPQREEKYYAMGKELRLEFEDLLKDGALMLYPSYAEPPPRHYQPLLPPFKWTYTAILNVMEIPVTQVPLGLNGNGLPLGIQVGALHGNDHLTIAAAMALEEAFGGWVAPWKNQRASAYQVSF